MGKKGRLREICDVRGTEAWLARVGERFGREEQGEGEGWMDVLREGRSAGGDVDVDVEGEGKKDGRAGS